ncbi:TipJ family phage tail tip protein [Basfia succiniciproducens]|uniref:host specificity protein J n=1 Tax=Basfia succiniciproducens TaxID=653940 RepID=UPI003FCCF6C5
MGGKKQGSARTPHEAPDSLKSAQRLRAIGLISLGPIKGPVNKWKSTFFDNTPIQNENGVDDNDEASFNFKNTEVSFTLGTQDQLPLQGFEMSEREVSVSTEVKYTTPITRTVTDPDVTRLRVTLGVNALYEQNDQGDTNGTSVWFRILINGLPRATYEISGKSSSRFYRSYIVDNLPERPFTITVERTTTDSNSQRLQNATNWVSYTEIIDTKLSYPNMALVGIKTDSRYNPNFPNVNFLLYGRLVKVPSTYDPETRTYSTALWKGDWKQAWTNNPAWVFYDLVTDPLAGLGKRVGDYGLDKFQLYQIAKYCDELVDDGYGGKEPRMTANLWLTDQRSAYEVLSDMASVFRAIAVWNGTQFTAIQDRTADPVCTYSQANVIDGKFSRQYAAMKSIYTAAEVEYADERNMYQKAVEYVADDLMIERYGYNVKKMTAYATTSRGQAHRWGKWVLATSLLEQCTITFSVGRQGLLHLPGDIIEIADNDYAGKTLGGRIVAVNGKVVTLDQPIEISGNSYLSYLNDEMKVVKVAISSIDSKNKAVVTLATVPTGLEPMDDWVLKTPTVSTQLYRAIGITENDDGSYTITALQHEPQKESIVDGSASFIPVATTAHTGGLSKVSNAEVTYNIGGIKLTWSVPSLSTVVTYEVRLYRNGTLFRTYLGLTESELSFDDLPDGSYVAEIRAKNASGQLSDPVTRTFEINLTITRFVTESLLFSIGLDWDLPKTATVGNYTEVWRSTDNSIQNAIKIATLPYPQANYIINGVSLSEGYYFFLRCGDKLGNKGEFTEGVFGEADHNPDTLLNALEGQITKSQLGEELIRSLKADIDNAVDEEAKVRKEAVANAISQITAQAQATGTAINELRNADSQQAEKILTITAKAENALSGIQAEQKARADGDKANADKITAITARMGTAESTIANLQSTKASKTEVSSIAQQTVTAAMGDTKAQVSALSNAVTDANNKLKATHTIKTQAIAGGRTAIAGIAMGATSDGVTTESSVIVMADKFGIVANANDGNVKPVFSVVNNQVGIRGDLVVAGTVTNDKLSSGLGGNLLQNPIFSNDGYGWSMNHNSLPNGSHLFFQDPRYGVGAGSYFDNENVLRLGSSADAGITGKQIQVITTAPVNEGSWYIFSTYVGNYRCAIDLIMQFLDKDNNVINTKYKLITKEHSSMGLGNSARVFNKQQAPVNSRSVRLYLRKYATTTGNNDSWVWFSRPMLEECTEHATQPSAWVNAGVTSVHGGSIIANTIRGEHIQANQTLSSPNITGGTITGNTINGTTIKGSTITGTTINGGTVTGTTVKGGRIEGGVISGSTILGDVVKAVILTKKGNNFEGTVPASEISSRTVVVPSISFKANSGETSTVAIYIDGTKVSEASVSGIKEQITAQGITPPTTVSGTIMNGSSANYVSGTIPQATISTSFWLRVPVSGSISGYKQITGKNVVVRVTSNNATALSGQNSLVALVA